MKAYCVTPSSYPVLPYKLSKKQAEKEMRQSRLPSDELGIFYRQLAVMLRSGVALPQAVTALRSEKDLPRIRKRAGKIHKEMATGRSFAECLTRQSDLFNPALDKILALDLPDTQRADILQRFAAVEEHFSEVGGTGKALLKSVLWYPALVLTIVTLLTFLLLIFVIPVFEEMFAGLGGGLPAPTQLVVDISTVLAENSPYLLLLLLFFIAFLIFGRTLMYQAAEKMPGIGSLMKKIAVTQFAEYFSLMIAAGLPFRESLADSANSVKNPYFSVLLRGIAERAADIPQLRVQIQKSGLFPEMLVQAAAVSETAEHIGSAMGEAAAFYSKGIKKTAAKKRTLFEVVALFLLGIFVGGIVISMYLPMFTMAEAI
ncbi:MAG: hypothetical protein D3909_00225 [Candidatus Electrothrix sp. ATG1]|nr:hypothetical protein [Candidatus Electrothrix sp. ATG1]